MYAVPSPAVTPIAKAANATLRLFVRIALEASGLIVTMPWVHISRRSMVSIMGPPSMKRWKPGSAAASDTPATIAPSRKSAVAASEYRQRLPERSVETSAGRNRRHRAGAAASGSR